jgi:tRNA (mo5U34)-methyltransferase
VSSGRIQSIQSGVRYLALAVPLDDHAPKAVATRAPGRALTRAITPAMAGQSLRSKADAIRWYHTIDLGQGVVTRGVDDTPLRLVRLDLPASLEGCSVLDIGAWDGFFSFEAERRGASRVVATDYYSWHGLGWGTGAGKAGFELAREALGSGVEDLDLDVMELSPERVGTFDVVLFLGVLYHLANPLLALERVASVTRDRLVLETVVDMVGFRRPAVAFYPGRELNNDPTNWWGPNEPAVHGMLRTVGFDQVRTVTSLPSPPYRAARALVHWWKGKNRLDLAFRQDRAVFHARMPERSAGSTSP